MVSIFRYILLKNHLSIFRPNHFNILIQNCRNCSNQNFEKTCSDPASRGLVLGVYSNEEDRLDKGQLTPAAWRYNKLNTSGTLIKLLRLSGPIPKRGECRLLYNVEPNFSTIAVCGLGKKCLSYNNLELLDERTEAIRRAAATGCNELQKLHTGKIVLEDFGNAESAAEGATMALWAYQDLKNKKYQLLKPQIELHTETDIPCDKVGWNIGIQKANAQNLARQLQEMPSNLLTPTIFAQNVIKYLCKFNVNVEVRVRDWTENQQMNSFLAVSGASCEPLIFLELSYYGTNRNEKPIVLIGQGITYDSGGLCLKDINDLEHMRGDMTGAACAVGTCQAVACLKVPVNLRVLIPLCENAIGSKSFKPGSILTSVNGKSVEVQSTDNEDILVLLDALVYAQKYEPKLIIDIGNTSKDINKTFGEAVSGVFTNSEELWHHIQNASIFTGDRIWRMPLWNFFTKQVTSSNIANVQNVGSGIDGEPCKAAAFLKQFVTGQQWMHIDANSVMTTNGATFEYLRRGMTGRPTRTLTEFILRLVCRKRNSKFK